MPIETTRTLHCDRCGFQEVVPERSEYSWMRRPKRCDGYLGTGRSWVATPDSSGNTAVLCKKCGESLMDWWDRK